MNNSCRMVMSWSTSWGSSTAVGEKGSRSRTLTRLDVPFGATGYGELGPTINWSRNTLKVPPCSALPQKGRQ